VNARLFQLIVALTLITALSPISLAAQRPQTRQGFWISMSGGSGNLNWSCDGCSKRDHGGATIAMRLGGSPSQNILLGAEINYLLVDLGTAEINAGYSAFTVYWYPSATGGLFVKSGVGVGTYYQRTSDTVTAHSTSAALLLGAGYDIRVGRKISVNPMLTLWSSNKAYLKEEGVPIATGFRQYGVALQLGVTYHRIK
jgi:hypothetical protein